MSPLFLVVMVATADVSTPSSPASGIELPPPSKLEVSLGAALRARCSTREFAADRPVSRKELATLLWAMTGINRPDGVDPKAGKRTAPSAFGVNAVEVWVTSGDGTYRYEPVQHRLVPHGRLGEKDLRRELTSADWAQTAPLLVALVVHRNRYPENVRPVRRDHYAHADAGVIGENLYLACAAMGLGTVVTASAPREAGQLLGLGEDTAVVFVLPVGHPAK